MARATRGFKNRRSKTRRTSGGAASAPANARQNAGLVAALESVQPNEYDYERMVSYESDSIDTTKPYDAFVARQKAVAAALSPEDAAFVKSLVARIKSRKISNMDFESCQAMSTEYIFFDKNRNIVLANAR